MFPSRSAPCCCSCLGSSSPGTSPSRRYSRSLSSARETALRGRDPGRRSAVQPCQPRELQIPDLRLPGQSAGNVARVQAPVRWKNQLYYSAFGMSGMPAVIVGRGDQLSISRSISRSSAPATPLPTFPRPRPGPRRSAPCRISSRSGARIRVRHHAVQAGRVSRHRAGRLCLSGDGPGPARQAAGLGRHPRSRRRSLRRYGEPRRPRSESLSDQHVSARPGVHWTAPRRSLAAQAVTEAVNRLHGSALLTPFTIS